MKCGSVYTIMKACTVLKVVLTVSFFKKNKHIYLFIWVTKVLMPSGSVYKKMFNFRIKISLEIVLGNILIFTRATEKKSYG